MTYTQLQIEDRKILESLHKQRYSCRYIAKVLQVSHTTVSRELRRNSLNKEYGSSLREVKLSVEFLRIKSLLS